jgi:hypothetical protein
MASKKALEAMECGAWIIVIEILDKGELSAEDLNKQNDTVNMVVDILDLHAIVLAINLLAAKHDGLLPSLLSWAHSVYVCGMVACMCAVLPARYRQTPTTHSCISLLCYSSLMRDAVSAFLVCICVWRMNKSFPFLLSTVFWRNVADLRSRKRSSCHSGSTSAGRSEHRMQR